MATPTIALLVPLTLLACGSHGGAEPSSSSRQTAPARPAAAPAPAAELRFMTYNVNFGLAGDPGTIDLIAGSGAEIVFLQETNAEWERALRQRLADRYPHMEFHHCCRAGGLAVLSRWPFRGEDYVDSPIGWFPGWRLVLETPLGEIEALNLHLRPPGQDRGSYLRGYFTSQPARLGEAQHYAATLEGRLPTLVAGDFNEDDGGQSARFFVSRGLVDLLPRFHGFRTTWRWQTAAGTVRWQLDHVMAGNGLAATAIDTLDGGASDHLPVVATLTRAR